MEATRDKTKQPMRRQIIVGIHQGEAYLITRAFRGQLFGTEATWHSKPPTLPGSPLELTISSWGSISPAPGSLERLRPLRCPHNTATRIEADRSTARETKQDEANATQCEHKSWQATKRVETKRLRTFQFHISWNAMKQPWQQNRTTLHDAKHIQPMQNKANRRAGKQSKPKRNNANQSQAKAKHNHANND